MAALDLNDGPPFACPTVRCMPPPRASCTTPFPATDCITYDMGHLEKKWSNIFRSLSDCGQACMYQPLRGDRAKRKKCEI